VQYHHNAKTNIFQRISIKQSNLSSRELADHYGVSHVTICKWKHVEHVEDKKSRPETIHFALSKTDERILIRARKKGLFSLDDLLDTLSPYLVKLNRSNCYRTLVRYRLNNFTKQEEKKRKIFATYDPGYLHIDVFYLPKIEGKRCFCFLAVDRTTKLVFLEIYSRRTHEQAADFLVKCLEFFPYQIHRILTDNGTEFTLRHAYNKYGKILSESIFDIICEMAGIKHKLTKFNHPWTNGCAERMVRTVKEHTIKAKTYSSLSEMIKDIKRYQDTFNFNTRLRVLRGKTPIQAAYEWFLKKPEIFFRDLPKC
jgi:transposase-like protein